jgi:thymidylate kinase
LSVYGKVSINVSIENEKELKEMIDTRIIIIDGMPGSGKSTTAGLVSERLKGLNVTNLLFQETTEGNPLFFNTPVLGSLQEEEKADKFIAIIHSLYSNFIQDYTSRDEVIIIESVIFQDIISCAFNMGMDRNKLLELARVIQESLAPFRPVLIYFYQLDIEKNWRYICRIRGSEFTNSCNLHTDEDFQRAALVWTRAQDFVVSIINNWDIPKLMIRNRDYKWSEYMENAYEFLMV